MKYLLTVLTNGRPDYLARTLEAFAQHVTPKPTAVYVFDDGGRTGENRILDAVNPLADDPAWAAKRLDLAVANPPLGMCGAHACCWNAAAASDLPWVFHLEDDMRVLCPIDLTQLADVMDADSYLVQMALKRTPWGGEVEYGGYIEKTPGWYIAKQDLHGSRWFETARNWTCAPTLFRTQTARDFQWSPSPGCETEIGPRMITARHGAGFGIWGGGECHVAHIGVDRAPGAKGY